MIRILVDRLSRQTPDYAFHRTHPLRGCSLAPSALGAGERRLCADAQSDAEAATEIEAASESTTMEVPVALVPTVQQLMAKRPASRSARTKTPNKAVAPAHPPVAGRKERERFRSGGSK